MYQPILYKERVMAMKKAAAKSTSRKSQAKKANVPMKNTPSAKSPKAETKAAASRAARTMARTAAPGVRKSAAKRVETTESRAAARSDATDISKVKSQMTQIIKALREDCKAAEQEGADTTHFCSMILAVNRAVTNARKKQAAQ